MQNVEDMKKDFESMTMKMTQMKTSMNNMKDTGQILFFPLNFSLLTFEAI